MAPYSTLLYLNESAMLSVGFIHKLCNRDLFSFSFFFQRVIPVANVEKSSPLLATLHAT